MIVEREDYISAAAELVGWLVDSNTLTGRNFIELPQMSRETDLGISAHWRDFEDPVAKDALAAQLVRQVDVIEWPNNVFLTLERKRCYCNNNAGSGESRGHDRTMNTIKAIVDAGVLQPAGELDGNFK